MRRIIKRENNYYVQKFSIFAMSWLTYDNDGYWWGAPHNKWWTPFNDYESAETHIASDSSKPLSYWIFGRRIR